MTDCTGRESTIWPREEKVGKPNPKLKFFPNQFLQTMQSSDSITQPHNLSWVLY